MDEEAAEPSKVFAATADRMHWLRALFRSRSADTPAGEPMEGPQPGREIEISPHTLLEALDNAPPDDFPQLAGSLLEMSQQCPRGSR